MRSNLAGIPLLLLASLATAASAKMTPPQKCAAHKLRAAGVAASAAIQCWSKAVQKNKAVDATCLQRQRDALVTAFVNLDPLGCYTSGDVSVVSSMIQAFVDQTNLLLPDPGLDVDGGHDAGKCAAKKLEAVGKLALARLLCQERAVRKNLPISDPMFSDPITGCLAKAVAKLTNQFAKLDGVPAPKNCATVGDASTNDHTTWVFEGQIASHLETPRFAAVLPIFEGSCQSSQCHGVDQPQQGLELDADAYAALVGVPAVQLAGQYQRVEVGNAADSYLYMKLVDDPRIEGVQMPMSPLPKAQQSILRAWINAGAPAPSFAEMVDLFDSRCEQSSCHGSVQAQQNLRLDLDPYAALVGIRSTEDPSHDLVAVGSSTDSYLWQKIHAVPPSPAHGGVSTTEQSAVAAWISAGAEPPSFTRDLVPLFQAKCEQPLCHGAIASQQHLRLDEDPYGAIVGIASTEVAKALVVPGDPMDSYLWEKLAGVPGIFGLPMPPFGTAPPVTATELVMVASWISAGAPRN